MKRKDSLKSLFRIVVPSLLAAGLKFAGHHHYALRGELPHTLKTSMNRTETAGLSRANKCVSVQARDSMFNAQPDERRDTPRNSCVLMLPQAALHIGNANDFIFSQIGLATQKFLSAGRCLRERKKVSPAQGRLCNECGMG